jgi:hypothetical protein
MESTKPAYPHLPVVYEAIRSDPELFGVLTDLQTAVACVEAIDLDELTKQQRSAALVSLGRAMSRLAGPVNRLAVLNIRAGRHSLTG